MSKTPLTPDEPVMDDVELLEPARLTFEQLQELARGIVTNKIFTSLQISSDDMHDMLPMVFLPIVFGALHGYKLESVGMLYSDMKDAAPRSVNGYPCFFACAILHRNQLDPLTRLIKPMYEALGVKT